MSLMVRGTLFVIAAAVATSALAASGISVRKTTKVDGAPADVWAKIGGFCAIKEWHPVVKECAESSEGETRFRTLTLADGGILKEKLTGTTETGYTYAIIDGPLPVKDYFASFSAREDADEPGKTIVVWSSSFASKGKPDSEARATIEGIFTDGLANVAKQSGS